MQILLQFFFNHFNTFFWSLVFSLTHFSLLYLTFRLTQTCTFGEFKVLGNTRPVHTCKLWPVLCNFKYSNSNITLKFVSSHQLMTINWFLFLNCNIRIKRRNKWQETIFNANIHVCMCVYGIKYCAVYISWKKVIVMIEEYLAPWWSGWTLDVLIFYHLCWSMWIFCLFVFISFYLLQFITFMFSHV